MVAESFVPANVQANRAAASDFRFQISRPTAAPVERLVSLQRTENLRRFTTFKHIISSKRSPVQVPKRPTRYEKDRCYSNKTKQGENVPNGDPPRRNQQKETET